MCKERFFLGFTALFMAVFLVLAGCHQTTTGGSGGSGGSTGGPMGYFANMVEDAVACYRDPSRQPRSSAADGLRVIEYLNSVKAWRG